jgi:hypothetical protein
MNQLNRALLLPSSMIVVVVMVVSNIMSISLLSPGNTSGLSSNIVVYNRGELVTISVLFIVLIGLLILLTRTLKQRTKRRRTFSTQMKKLIPRNQNFKCVRCRVNAGIWDFDHKDGNRAYNKASKCQALGPTYHARKSRGLIKCETQNKSKSISIGIVVGIVLMIILFSYM